MRSNGGLSGAKKTVSTSAASGIWTIRDAQREQSASNWPVVTYSFSVRYLIIGGGGSGGKGTPGVCYGGGGGFVLKVAHRRCLSKMTDGEANGA